MGKLEQSDEIKYSFYCINYSQSSKDKCDKQCELCKTLQRNMV